MYDKDLIGNIIGLVINSVQTVLDRFEPINSISDFSDNPAGMEKLDAICMQLIAIGEGLKNIDKISDGTLLSKYPQIDWKGAKAMRDIITHHYFEVDAEVIYDVCLNKLPTLKTVLMQMSLDLSEFE